MDAGWQGILDPGETVIWQDQPDPRPDMRDFEPKKAVFGLAVAAFAVFWTAMAFGAGGVMGLVLPLFGLPFIAIGLRRAGAGIFWDAYRRRRTWYTLTNQRAFIATDIFGHRRLDAYPINVTTPIVHESGRDIWFATDFIRTKSGSRRKRIGFTHLKDSSHVHDLMRRVQREATQE